MKHGTYQERALLRRTSDLLLELPSRPDAGGLLCQAVAYLHLLERQGESEGLPLVVSIRAVRVKTL